MLETFDSFVKDINKIKRAYNILHEFYLYDFYFIYNSEICHSSTELFRFLSTIKYFFEEGDE